MVADLDLLRNEAENFGRRFDHWLFAAACVSTAIARRLQT
jgi:hypothetical protein